MEIKIITKNSICSGEKSRNLNIEQQTAVVNIVRCNNGPVPYILDGPPGS